MLVQLGVVAGVSLLLAAPGGLVVPGSGRVWFAVVVTAVPCTALAYCLQTWAQRRLSATSTAVVLTGEPLFAGLAAVWLGGEVLGPRVLLGGLLIHRPVGEVRQQPDAGAVPTAAQRAARQGCLRSPPQGVRDAPLRTPG